MATLWDCLSVSLIGIGTVFLGLVCLVGICKLLGFICMKTDAVSKKKKAVKTGAVTEDEIPDKQQLIAAISAAVAEDLGEDVTKIRILSIEKIGKVF